MQLSKHVPIKRYMKFYLLPYLLLFLVLSFLIFYAFFSQGRTFIWNYDGAYQHFPLLSYYSDYLKGLLSGQGLPLVDFSIGLGFDIITSLNYYVLGDPLSLFSFFFSQENMEFFYSTLVLIRYFLIGVSFSLFCFYKKKAPFPTLLATILYTFCSFSLIAGVRHPFFLNPMIYLPLLLIGIEQLLTKRKSLFLSAMVAISALSNFYFLYMLTIIIVVYATVRFYEIFREHRFKEFRALFLRGLLYYLLGIGLSAILLFPTIYAFLQNGRLSDTNESTNLVAYNLSYYKNLVTHVFSMGRQAQNWSVVGIGVLGALGVFVLFFRQKHWDSKKILFLICSITILIPFLGKMMNGFSYVANRWCFAFSLLLAYLVAHYYEEFFTLRKKELLTLGGLCSLFTAFVLLIEDYLVWVPALFLMILFAMVCYFHKYPNRTVLRNISVLGLTVINLALLGNFYYHTSFVGLSADYLKYGQVKSYTTSTTAAFLTDYDSTFYRLQNSIAPSPNEAITSGYAGISFYLSLMNESVLTHMTELNNSALRFSCQYLNYDNRTILNSLTGVKYFITDSFLSVPYGHKLVSEDFNLANGDLVYKNHFALPLGYAYDHYITSATYSLLSPLEKQEALMQCIVLEDPTNHIEQTNPSFHISELPYTITYGAGMNYDGKQVTVTEDNSRFQLSYNAPKNSELYLSLENFDITNSGQSKLHVKTKSNGYLSNLAIVRSKTAMNYFGVSDYLINLGFAKKHKNSTTVTLNSVGNYTLSTIRLVALSLDSFKEQYKALADCTLQDITIDTNKISGSITSIKNEFLLLTIPYSPGWSAYVDGAKVTTVKANTMFLGFPISPGTHQIELRYKTPFLTLGTLCSSLSLLLFVILLLRNRQQKGYYKQ